MRRRKFRSPSLSAGLLLLVSTAASGREYGLLNYGDSYAIPWDSWGNLEYDMAKYFFVQYIRIGDRRYFDRAESAA